MITVPMTIATSQVSIPVSVGVSQINLPVALSAQYAIVAVDVYDGDYEITPSDTVQVLATQDKKCTENIVINPIPSNYGLVTWNGAYLTIS